MYPSKQPKSPNPEIQEEWDGWLAYESLLWKLRWDEDATGVVSINRPEHD